MTDTSTLRDPARDIGILLAQIDWLQECTGETLEAEDAALVAQIRADWNTRAILDAQTEQPDLQLSARKVEGDAPDQTEVSSGPSAAPTDNTALVEALDVCLEWIDAVPSDTPLPAMPGFDRDWVDNIRNRAALASREAKPAPDAVAAPCPCICHTQKGITHVIACCDQPPFDAFAKTSAVPQIAKGDRP